tara:strand:- start:762 stop:959 length:198 start_codon:yes stop_codon:yes gene_type:complete
MKENIFTINNRLQKGEITTEQAKNELLVLFGVVDTEGECCESGCDWKHSHTNWWQCTVCKDIQAR